MLKSRHAAAQLFDTELRNAGWAPGTRLPRFSASKFVAKLVWSKCKTMETVGGKAKALRRWHSLLQQMGVDEPSRSSGRSLYLKNGSARPPVEYGRRQRRLGLQGTGPIRCAWVREALYQWFVSIRYSVDLKACEGKARSSGQPKCLARFTKGLLRQKLKQLTIDDCSQCLVRGKRPTTFQPTATWFAMWQRGYGLSMRKPSRKHAVPNNSWLNGWRSARLTPRGFAPCVWRSLGMIQR